MKRVTIVLVALAYAALSPNILAGQEAPHADPAHTFELTPYIGAYFHHVDDRGVADDADITGGVRIAFGLGSNLQLVGNIGYAEVDGFGDVGGPEDKAIIGINRWRTTVGLEFNVVQGPTSASAHLGVGAFFGNEELEGTVGNPSDQTLRGVRGGDWSVKAVVAPGIAVEHRIAPAVRARIGFEDQIHIAAGLLETGAYHHNLALRAGISFGL